MSMDDSYLTLIRAVISQLRQAYTLWVLWAFVVLPWFLIGVAAGRWVL